MSRSVAATGNGANVNWLAPEHMLVVVWRWYQGKSLDNFIALLLRAMK